MHSHEQKWKPVGSTSTGRVDRPIGLPVGSKFFDRPVKPVETPVKFSFLATKKHLSTNQYIHIYCIINKTFYKNTILTNHTVEAVTYMLRPLRHAHPGAYLGGAFCEAPLWATAQNKTMQNILQNRAIRL